MSLLCSATIMMAAYPSAGRPESTASRPMAALPVAAPLMRPRWDARCLRIRVLGVLAQLAGPTAIIRPAPAARCR
jgi:hypothetical protein